MANLVTTDGKLCALIDASLLNLQNAVGGHLEVIPLDGGRFLVVNEEGKALGLPTNIAATTLFHLSGGNPHDYIAGPAVLCDREEID